MDITQLEEEETSAILDGMRALNKLFYDPRCRRVGGGDGDDDGKEKAWARGEVPEEGNSITSQLMLRKMTLGTTVTITCAWRGTFSTSVRSRS
jgi:hypothetical protein